jgi:hypothetical protein
VGLFGPSRKEFQRVQDDLASARAERQQLAERLTQAEAQNAAVERTHGEEVARREAVEAERDTLVVERDMLVEERDAVRVERDTLSQERDTVRAERDAIAADRDKARAERDAAWAEADELRRRLAAARGPTGSEASGEGEVDASWPLVLADLERRWAAGVGALPAARGVSGGPVSAQLAEGVIREVERLREEMGVDVSLTRGEPVEPARPVVFLLAATDLLGALAATCERVAVSIDGSLVLTGEVWAELGDDLEVSRTRALAAGVVIDPIDVGDDQVRITLRP